MKKLLFLIFLASLQFSSTQAQQISKANLILNKPVKATGTTQNKTTPATQTTVSVYSLTSVRVNIRTGNDNKEYPSGVRVSLGARGSNMVYAYFVQENLKNEMKSNSNTEFGMEKAGKNLKDITLDVLQNTGFELRIAYSANFQFDARSEEHTSELQSRQYLVCRLLLEKK